MQKGLSSSPINEPAKKIVLKQQNLIPFYVIEDSLKSNFTQIQSFINTQSLVNSELQQKINNTNQSLKQSDIHYNKQFITIEQNIFKNIKSQIQTIVSHILNQKLSSVIQTISNYQSKQTQKQLTLINTINQMSKTLKYEIAQENQKYFNKEITKIQKDIDKKIHSVTEQKINTINKLTNTKRTNKSTPKYDTLNNEEKQSVTLSQQMKNNQQQSFNIVSQNLNKQVFQMLKDKVQKLQEFRTQLDKKFIDNFSSLKSSWKQLGSEILDNKKIVNKKIQELNIDVIKLKNLSEFKSLPETSDESFKKKVMQKLTDFYTIISTLSTKAQTDMINQRTKVTLTRHSQEISSLRDQFHKNAEYFTFYINNSNTDDLKQTINKLKHDTLQEKKHMNSVIEQILKQSSSGKTAIQQVVKAMGTVEMASQTLQGKIQKFIVNVQAMSDKIKTLQDLNDIDPFKMKKIHNVLDRDLNFSDTQPSLNQLQKLNSNNAQTTRQLKKQLQQLKDQFFVLTSQKNMASINQQDQIIQLKNQIKNLYKTFEKAKTQNQEVQLTRKPWIILSEKQSQELQSQRDSVKKLLKDSKKKISLESGKSGGYFNNDKSQKNISYKLSPTPQDKFEVYQKYREKYLSDTLKLPQIFKQKLGGPQELYK